MSKVNQVKRFLLELKICLGVPFIFCFVCTVRFYLCCEYTRQKLIFCRSSILISLHEKSVFLCTGLRMQFRFVKSFQRYGTKTHNGTILLSCSYVWVEAQANFLLTQAINSMTLINVYVYQSNMNPKHELFAPAERVSPNWCAWSTLSFVSVLALIIRRNGG